MYYFCQFDIEKQNPKLLPWVGNEDESSFYYRHIFPLELFFFLTKMIYRSLLVCEIFRKEMIVTLNSKVMLVHLPNNGLRAVEIKALPYSSEFPRTIRVEICIFIYPVLIYNLCSHFSHWKNHNDLWIFTVSFIFFSVVHYKDLDSLSEREELCYYTFNYSLNCNGKYFRIW